ncbi:hypothetical protein [Bacillus cereus]|uniref:hypothetical protein n=1 Tax=Bacillus cereus TaxID=1396 RepID=UPI003D647D6A
MDKLPLKKEILEKLSDEDKQTISDILLIANEVRALKTTDCEENCEIAAEIAHLACNAITNPLGRAACHVVVEIGEDVCKSSC